MNRVYNFSAGPSTLPEEVLKQAADEMLDYKGCGMSVMEMSHRSKVYEEIIHNAEASLRKLMGIPENYKVLFLQGGASLQFAMVPLNLMRKSKRADYVNTGEWAKKAIKEAKRYGEVRVVGSSEEETYNHIPSLNPADFDKEADYFHITSNNTIFGTKFKNLPDTGDVPLVADMSSDILSCPVDVTKYGLIYAGAQKNMGPAGLTVVIVREDLVGHAPDTTPTMLNYKTHADAGSMFNTPPTFAVYIAGMVFDWVLAKGGLVEMEKINVRKANLLYDYLDQSKLFKGTVVKEDRSIMNIPFVTPSAELDAKFIKEAEAQGFVNLKGHRIVGGMRASIYNAMPVEGVEKLVALMKDFEARNA
ncbi:3-phosphoserine/phosphohydroxythreonine transaminase [Anaerotalea alkaliphila]|uniref:Phosphoserine aminotransferase n=1 Tax=Anaerotalea alkaliphila TaxID=2662126 RepID=A0A7X5HUZ6_9FIRM|nr:3-phosphoserine/phosphohydroxythreonine transaminase [Anaerotalea alkaliphila]NDL66926.1 3-phosphoserine/phosphohydroxythreonine transaminase [Anaerotalea alkaliphila]